jgi:hypothetical protein
MLSETVHHPIALNKSFLASGSGIVHLAYQKKAATYHGTSGNCRMN